MHLVVASAFLPELLPYAPDAEGRIDLDGTPARGVAVGIGLVAAAIGAAALARTKPPLVVFSGTCGAYPGSLAILDVVVGTSLELVLPTVVEGRARVPDAFAPSLAAPRGAVDALVRAGAREVRVATTPAITIDDNLAARVAIASGCGAEHLEAYSVAAACASFDVPFVAVLGVANRVGARANVEWRENHEAASARAAAVVRAAARSLAELSTTLRTDR